MDNHRRPKAHSNSLIFNSPIFNSLPTRMDPCNTKSRQCTNFLLQSKANDLYERAALTENGTMRSENRETMIERETEMPEVGSQVTEGNKEAGENKVTEGNKMTEETRENKENKERKSKEIKNRGIES